MIQIDYSYTTLINIPVFMRLQKRYDWLRLHSVPLETMNGDFDNDYNAYTFSALHNSQVLSLEHFLNTILTPLTDIYITDGIFLQETYIYIRDEAFRQDDYYIYTRAEAPTTPYVYTRHEYDFEQVDYYVYLEGADSGLQVALASYLDEFNPAGRQYNIILY